MLHAVGAAEAGVIYSRVAAIPDRESRFTTDEVVYVSLGDGATSEGEFWEALNTACTKQLPVLFLVEDNGYAISVPVEVQTPGGDISRLVRSFPGLHVDSVDGTDFFASLRAMREATAYVRARKGPALVHARVHPAVLAFAVRRREAVQDAGGARSGSAARSASPRFAEFLRANGSGDRRRISRRLRADVDREINEAALASARRRRKPAQERPPRSGSTRRTSIRRPPRSTRRRRPEGKPGHDGRPRSTAR